MSTVTGFDDDFSKGINKNRWIGYNWQWGANNNGCIPEYIMLEQDDVVLWDGTKVGKKNVCALWGHGDLVSSTPIRPALPGVNQNGSRNVPVSRVGSCMVTKDSFSSGRYEVDCRIWNPWNGRTVQQGKAPSGTVFSAWTFHYESHNAKSGDSGGTQINPNDLQYQPSKKQGSAGGYYSTVNSEIDAPEIGVSGAYGEANFNTWLSEIEYDIKVGAFPNALLDGRYHRFAWEWRNKSQVLTGVTDNQVAMANGYHRIAVAGVFPQYQSLPLVKKSDGKWYVLLGQDCKFYADGVLIRSTTLVSPVSARLVIGNWFASWAGAANWEFCKFTIHRVMITPYNMDGDVYLQRETSVSPSVIIPGSVDLPLQVSETANKENENADANVDAKVLVCSDEFAEEYRRFRESFSKSGRR
eukprot:ANDGO_08165.mRNA.1 hypothetical protein